MELYGFNEFPLQDGCQKIVHRLKIPAMHVGKWEKLRGQEK